MTKQEVRNQKKFTALNAIRKIYHPLSVVAYSNYPEDGSYREQRDEMVKRIINKLEEELKNEDLRSKI